MPPKFERCVQHVKDSGKADGVNPWAVCHASTGEIKEIKPEEPENLLNEVDNLLTEVDDMMSKDYQFPPKDASYKHTGPMSTKKTPTTYGNTAKIMDETVSIPGSLSGVSIKGKKKEARPMKETIYKAIFDAQLNTCGCKKKR